MITENLATVEQKIQAACQAAGRKREEVTLIAVSKTKPISMLKEVYETNIRDFGENKVQELCQKMDELPSDIRWHMIGHLQRNKVKYIVGRVALIHSVDTYRLAEEINIQAKKKNIIVPILVEVNIAGEDFQVRNIGRGCNSFGGGDRKAGKRAHSGTDDDRPKRCRCRGEPPVFPQNKAIIC